MLGAFLNFDKFIFPRIATVIYWIGLVLIILGALGGAITALFVDARMGGGFIPFLIALVMGVVGIVIWRLVVEFWLVIFSIRDTLRDIRDQGRRV